MKKHVLLLVFICVICQVKANTTSHTFRFNESDFRITSSVSDSLNIVSLSEPAMYSGSSEPGIPIVGRSIILTDNGTVKNYSVTFGKRLIRSGVDLANAEEPIPTSMIGINSRAINRGYVAKIYPDSNCVLTKCLQIGGVELANFLVTPFVFDAEERNLYFIDSLQLDIELEASRMRSTATVLYPSQIELLQDIAENPEVLEQIPSMTSGTEITEWLDYLIITNNALKSSFQPLADWKRKKGLSTRIITVEEINQNYSGATQQIRIKACIKDLRERNGLQFVLLGGDDNIIPPQYCVVDSVLYNYNYNYFNDSIPTDVYYACSGGELDWDTNHDGLTGDMSNDDADINPDLYVTRAPVRTAEHVNTFVNRTINYEQTPQYRRELFQGGTGIGHSTYGYIFGESLADSLFNDIINGKIIMGAWKFFDTYT